MKDKTPPRGDMNLILPNGSATQPKDMKTWTDHGAVLKPTDFEWGIGEAWASQVIEHDGKFYYYTSLQAGKPYNSKVIGVAVSDSPTGPFTDPIGKPLITDDMTSNEPRGWWNDIDPTLS